MTNDDLREADGSPLRICHAGSIRRALSAVADEFIARRPGTRILMEKGGSVDLVKKIAAGETAADLVVTADYRNIADFLCGKHADWLCVFATTSMVLAYTDKSRYSGTIGIENWHEVLSLPGVRIMWGDHDADPGAYRRIMIGKLAEKYYEWSGLAGKIEANVISPDARGQSHAIPLARSGQVDYVFMYRPAAAASGLKFMDLPPQVNLSDPAYRDFYRSVGVISSGVNVRGDLIGYGVTIPRKAQRPDLAMGYLKLLLGPAGSAAMKDDGFEPIRPYRAFGNVPDFLK